MESLRARLKLRELVGARQLLRWETRIEAGEREMYYVNTRGGRDNIASRQRTITGRCCKVVWPDARLLCTQPSVDR